MYIHSVKEASICSNSLHLDIHCIYLVTELTQLYTAFISYCLCFSPLQFGGARVAEGEPARLVGTRRSSLLGVTSPSTLGSS